MQQPLGYVFVGKKTKVCRLLKTFYGLKQSPHILYIKATVVSVCLCGQCLEDSSSHCPFPKNNSFEHTEQGVLNCLGFWPLGVCLHWGGSPKPRHGIFKDMIFRT